MKKYPRIGRLESRAKNTSAKCRCSSSGKFRAHIQIDHMRGNDVVVWACQDHKKDVGFLLGDGE